MKMTLWCSKEKSNRKVTFSIEPHFSLSVSAYVHLWVNLYKRCSNLAKHVQEHNADVQYWGKLESLNSNPGVQLLSLKDYIPEVTIELSLLNFIKIGTSPLEQSE